MRNLSSAIAAAALALVSGVASATVLTLDDFNGLPNSGNVTLFSPGLNVTATAGPSNPYSRVTTTQITDCPAGCANTGFDQLVRIGNSSSPAGLLQVNNGNNYNSFVQLDWTLPAGYFTAGLNAYPNGGPGVVVAAGSPVSFFFKVATSDANPITATFFVNGVGIPGATFSLAGNLSNVSLNFDLPPGAFNSINAGGAFQLRLTGQTSWDASLDEFGFSIPEPTSLALTGLALLGAGLASRRRKA